MNFKHFMANDNICAIATAHGGAIGIIRVSGPDAIIITDKIFSKPVADAATHTIHYGEVADCNGLAIDNVLVSVFRTPHSYTGENSTEISCHGSRYIMLQVLHTLIAAGCRQALPGEFTQRAFLNGKMDLSQAEAVADLIAATNRATHSMAFGQLRGNFSSRLAELRDRLLEMTSLLELELDFSDQDVTFADRQQLLALSKNIEGHIRRLADSFRTGQALKNGIPVAIIGKTNVGKSTLLNRLLHDDKAIVSDIHGTTRDVIEDTIEINNLTFRFIDTAGIRSTNDKVEQLGIERTYRKISEAAIILWVIDGCPSAYDIESVRKHCEGKKVIIVRNKSDECGKFDTAQPGAAVVTSCPSGLDGALSADGGVIGDMFDVCKSSIMISAKYGTNMPELENAIYAAADIPEISENDVIVTNARHYDALINALHSIAPVISGLENNLSGDLLSEDLRLCISHLGDIVGGEISTNETLQTIFSKFCIGK